MFSFSSNHKTVKEIFEMYEKGTLVVDDSYQRRSVWSEKDKIRLVETILLNLVIPELFFWQATIEPDSGENIIHIVDGQQRVKAIVEFMKNSLFLKEKMLLDKEAKKQYGDRSFSALTPEDKARLWNYRLMIVEIDRAANRDDIVNVFRRLNLTDYNLNDQEKRNSIPGEFGALAKEISDLDIWEKTRVFKNSDVKRMRDVEFCASLILLGRRGIIDQSDQSALNHAYEDFSVNYNDADVDRAMVFDAVGLLPLFFKSKKIGEFLRKKSQLYTLFSILFYMNREGRTLEDRHLNNLSIFVDLYSVFSNAMQLPSATSECGERIFDNLKRYKLASSEGLNKYTNRMIRYTILKAFIFETDDMVLNEARLMYKRIRLLKEKDEPPLLEECDSNH